MAGGEANSYYQMPDGGNDRAKDYPMQPQQAYNQNSQQHYQQQDYQQQNYQHAPPQYGQNFNPRPEMNGYDNKPTFEQAFKIDKPKYNDWWAGLLFLAVFAGYVVVSGISLQGYGMYKHICACIGICLDRTVLTIDIQPPPRDSTVVVSTIARTILASTPTPSSSSPSVSSWQWYSAMPISG
jgi:hypothetical protein